jgi:hypothetical protein
MLNPVDINLDKLRQIGWDNWDPIGIRGFGDDAWKSATADEYDRYMLHVGRSLIQGGRIDDAVAYLDNIASEHMGLGPITPEGHAASQRTVEAIATYLRDEAD